MTYADTIRISIADWMATDKNVVLMGIDVLDGLYGTTTCLAERFSNRVIVTPVAEESIIGIANGMAMAGLRPIVCFQRADFLMLAMNQLVNISAKAKDMWGNQVKCPIIVRAIVGRSWGQGAQHTQSNYSFFHHVPGFGVSLPAAPEDVRDFWANVKALDDPVIVFEHRMLFDKTDDDWDFQENDPQPQVMLVGVSHMLWECQQAARLLRASGLFVGVHNLTSQFSIESDVPVLMVDNDWIQCGFVQQVAAMLMAKGLQKMAILGHERTSCPTARELERRFYPNAASIAQVGWHMVTGEVREFATLAEGTTRGF